MRLRPPTRATFVAHATPVGAAGCASPRFECGAVLAVQILRLSYARMRSCGARHRSDEDNAADRLRIRLAHDMKWHRAVRSLSAGCAPGGARQAGREALVSRLT